MHWVDLINGIFESIGAVVIWINVRQVIKDKFISGVHWVPALFWTVYSFWGLIYYYTLHQPISLIAGISIALGQAIWLGLFVKYWRPNVEKRARRKSR